MKTIPLSLFAFLLFNFAVRAQPSGYTRGGAEATMKQMKLLFYWILLVENSNHHLLLLIH